MNKTFKVVYNRARGSLMVANEITCSVQKKGTKAIVAATVLLLATGLASATDYSNKTWEGDHVGVSQAQVNSSSNAITVTGDSFTNNTLTFTSTAGSPTAAGVAGSNVDATITDSNFTKNTVSDSESSKNGVYGSAVGLNKGKLTVKDSSFDNNSSSSYRQVQGSAIYQTVGEIDIANSTFTNNSGQGLTKGETQGVATGGAISLWGVKGKIDQATFTNNQATADDIAYGGALYLRDGFWGGDKDLTVAITNSNFSNNSVKGKNGRGGALYAKSTYSADSKEHAFLNLTLEKVQFINNEASWMGGAAYVTGEGSITLKDVSFEGNKAAYGSALMAFANKDNEANLQDVRTTEIKADNVNYLNNIATGGGTVYLYTQANYEQTGGSFVGNKTITQSGHAQGAFVVKGSNATFTDVLFENNTAESANSIAAGGAVFVDSVSNDVVEAPVPGTVTFHITKDITYSGNNVIGQPDEENTYGYRTATAGGFLHLDRGTSATFDIEDGATLTVGNADASGNMDTIASSIRYEEAQTSASMKKTGQGTLVVNSDLNKYYGKLDVAAGKMEVTKQWTILDDVTVSGGTLSLNDFSFEKQPSPLEKEGSIFVKKGGTLETASNQIFTAGIEDASTNNDAGSLKYEDKYLKFEEGGSLALTDSEYSLDYANSAAKLLGTSSSLVMLGDLVNKDKINEASLDDLKTVSGNTVLAKTTVIADNNIQIGGDPESGYDYRADSLSVGSVDLGSANTIKIDGEKTLTLAGNGDEAVQSTDENGTTVNVESGSTLALGGSASQGGKLSSKVALNSGNLVITGAKTFTVENVSGTGNVKVGGDEAGKAILSQVDGVTVDVSNSSSVTSISDASQAQIKVKDEGVTAEIKAAKNAVVSLGNATTDQAISAYSKLASVNGLDWAEDGVSAVLYVDAPTKVSSGGIVIGSNDAITSGTVAIGKSGLLIANQANGSADAMIDGALTLAEGSSLGLVNSRVGTLKLATSVTDNGTTVITDNPFITGAVDAGQGV